MKNALITALVTASVAAIATPAQAATSQRVMFESNGERLVGDLYLPDDYEAGDKLSAVVVTGAWTTVKEQMPRRYAIELADKGYAALTFDYRNWGQSDGDQRYLESPAMKIADIQAAAAFLATRNEVNAMQIGGLGICASAGYMAAAVARSGHLNSLALVAPWLHDQTLVEAIYGGKVGVATLINTSRQAQQEFRSTGALALVPAAGEPGSDAIMQGAPYYTDPEQEAIPEYDNFFNLASWEGWLTFDSISTADELSDTPVRIIHSDAAAIPQGARAFYDRLSGPKSELWLENVTQFEFYDQQGAVARATGAVVAHFDESLG